MSIGLSVVGTGPPDEPLARGSDLSTRSAQRLPGRSIAKIRAGELVLWIATTNLFKSLNATTRQVAGAAW
jgi:hypothetical protein